MNRSNISAGISLGRTRREALGLLGAGVAAIGAAAMPRSALAQGDETILTEALVLRDPEIPAVGNVDGDINIVEWFDYNCPYCRKIDPELRQVVQDDGKVRLVLKDWPILGEVSKIAARMALAAKYQDKFIQAHDAMIGVSSRLTEPRIRELLAGAGVDMDRLKRDLTTNAKAIDSILARVPSLPMIVDHIAKPPIAWAVTTTRKPKRSVSGGRRLSSSASSACPAP